MLIAEDHTGWDKVTQPPEAGGLGFDATWYAGFYHDLTGAADASNGHARLLKNMGYGDDRALGLSTFASTLAESRHAKVNYHASHDEVGNSAGSMRTLTCAVDSAALVGATRTWAEARGRLTFGLSLLSAGTPMFFMGEEVGATQPYRWNDFIDHREDLAGLRAGDGAKLFRFYQDLIRFSRRHPAVRVQGIDVVHVNEAGRVIAWRRSTGTDELLIVANLANQAYDEYGIATDPSRLPDGAWRELFNSDSSLYGGSDFGNLGLDLIAAGGRISLRLPAVGLLAFAKV
jgi:1,4-alpha-glucan branching enzyme